MKERELDTLKHIKDSLVSFKNSIYFNEWDGVGISIEKAIGLMNKAIREAGEKVEKRYIGVFYDRNTKEEFEIPFWSAKKAGSYTNRLDAEFTLHDMYRKESKSIKDVFFRAAYREKDE